MTELPSFPETAEQPIAYVRALRPDQLPDGVRAQAKGLDHVYAIATAEGQVLALVDDRDRAFTLARMNDFAPVSVH